MHKSYTLLLYAQAQTRSSNCGLCLQVLALQGPTMANAPSDGDDPPKLRLPVRHY